MTDSKAWGNSSTPLPLRLIERLLESSPRPVLTIGVGVFVPFMALVLLTGSLYPVDISPWNENPLEITGLFLMMSALPAYLMMSFTASTRLAASARTSLSALLSRPEDFDALLPRSLHFWPLALGLGWLFGMVFNIGWFSLSFDPADPRFAVSCLIVFGQLYLWTAASLVIFFAVNEGILLHRVGRRVQVDLYNLNKLNIFGRTGLLNMLLIAGALALTTLQSLDRTFRWDNYGNALLVAIPAALLLIPLPIWSIHRRIKTTKREEISKLNAAIDETERDLGYESLQRLNALLQRRELIQGLRNWPMDLSIVSRFVLYVFIPPLAWVSAALVEMRLDAALAAG